MKVNSLIYVSVLLAILYWASFQLGYFWATQDFEQGTGGVEIEVERRTPTFEEGYQFLFPIAKEDFLFFSSPYGMRVSPILGVERKHTGVDICGVWRSQVVAVADGTIIEHWPPPDGYFKGHPVHGGYVIIEHENGFQTHYSHMSWTRVRTGQQVKAGQAIGRIGRTGRATGNHLHFEVRLHNVPMNPLLYIPNPLEIDYRDYEH